jgi:hypothetical protein
VNDIVIATTEGKSLRHFVIQYEEGSKHYTIRDMENGSGTFVKIDREIELHTNYIISFGE